MASNGLPWFRLYSEILDDKKIKRICRVTPCSKAEVIGVWVCILSLANDSCKRGSLMMSDKVAYDLDDIEEITGVQQSKLEELMNLFIDLDMLTDTENGYEITNWNGRQFKSDDGTKRVQEYRNKKSETLQNNNCNNDETLQKRYSNGVDTDTDTDTELTTTTADAFRVYEQEIGVITASIADRLKVDIQDYSEDWVIDAMKVASAKQARNLPYVEAILKRWKVEGKDAGKRKPRAEPAGTSGNDAILEEIRNGKF
jgi:DnaD/phage-associated family protein